MIQAYLWSIVHDGGMVIRNTQRADFLPVLLGEVMQLSILHICLVNGDVGVSVGSTLFMIEAQRVTNFMGDSTRLKQKQDASTIYNGHKHILEN